MVASPAAEFCGVGGWVDGWVRQQVSMQRRGKEVNEDGGEMYESGGKDERMRAEFQRAVRV